MNLSKQSQEHTEFHLVLSYLAWLSFSPHGLCVFNKQFTCQTYAEETRLVPPARQGTKIWLAGRPIRGEQDVPSEVSACVENCLLTSVVTAVLLQVFTSVN